MLVHYIYLCLMVFQMRWFDVLDGNVAKQAILSVEINFTLYHIYLDRISEGVWFPRNPVGENNV
jgi:hypothetical protein